ncbi:MAG: ribose-phosphate pyrophosphokinase [Deltaproteobacteria bacterium RIFOXYA12_FULL_61_11]|nr:MAG: ribose-phosphate pyrophosphokinase [Deltaproteobacteria bacterium RIFOXYA12_FULL_61_11]
MKVFAGSSHPGLAKEICSYLGMPLGQSETVKFLNGNLMVKIHENVREEDVFVVQTSCDPVHENMFELFMMIDALKHASAKRITAVIPYYPYVRSDKKDQPRISITARLVADFLETAGTNRVLTIDLHSPQIQGFFRMPVDQLKATNIICQYLRKRTMSDFVIVAGDAGEAKDVTRYANRLNLPMAIIDKRRYGNDDKPRAVNIIGEVEGLNALLIDDEVSTGRTLLEAAEFLHKKGVKKIFAACTHPVLCADATSRLRDSLIEELVTTNTIPIPEEKRNEKIVELSIAQLLASAINCIHSGNSISALFN